MNSKEFGYMYQKKVRERNRTKILSFVDKQPQRFTDLKRMSGFSPKGLTSILNDLKEDKKIQDVIHEGKPAYAITKKGKRSFLELSGIPFWLDEIEEGGGYYFDDYSNTWSTMMWCNLPWGITDDLALDKRIGKELNPITKEMARNLQEYFFSQLLENEKKKKIKLDETKEGKILLTLVIDYKELVKSLKRNSLQRYNRFTDKDFDVFERFDKGIQTKDDMKKLEMILKK